MDAGLGFLLFLLFIVVIVVMSSIRIVPQAHAYVIEREHGRWVCMLRCLSLIKLQSV